MKILLKNVLKYNKNIRIFSNDTKWFIFNVIQWHLIFMYMYNMRIMYVIYTVGKGRSNQAIKQSSNHRSNQYE